MNDKFQVRTTGPVDPLTRQPIKVSGGNDHPALAWMMSDLGNQELTNLDRLTPFARIATSQFPT